jgi:nicotinamide-nucleotide amidase
VKSLEKIYLPKRCNYTPLFLNRKVFGLQQKNYKSMKLMEGWRCESAVEFDADTMEGVVASLLKKKNLTLSVAESCTGGLISQRLTGIAGISENFMCGMVTYSNEAKIKFLGVAPETLKKYGAVSEETALEMARGARIAGGTHLAVSVTGIAGPGGGTAKKPVGLVYIGFADSDTTVVQKYLFAGDREAIRWQAANNALDLIRRYLLQYNA